MVDVGKRFDEVAYRYDTPDKLERSKKIIDKLLKVLPVNKSWKVLDVGIGTGNTAIYLSPHVKEIIGTDLSEGMLSVLKEKIDKMNIKNIKVFKKDILKEDFQETGFDLIFNAMTMHHIDYPQEAVKRFKKFLKKGGYIVIVDLYKEDGTFHSDNTDVKHFGFSFDEVKSWFDREKLETVFIDNIYTIKKIRGEKEREYPVFMAVGRSNLQAPQK
jgi:ubiquinone/menaquinone biosynthesis C-methylase UbiE